MLEGIASRGLARERSDPARKARVRGGLHPASPVEGATRAPVELKKILVRAPNWVGDGVMATPALAALRSHFKEAQITLLAKPAVSALLSHQPEIDRVMIYEDPGKHAGAVGFLRLVFLLRKERFDLAFLLQNAFEAALLAALAGIRERVGYDTDRRSFLLTRALPKENAPRHQRDAFSQLVSLVGGAIPQTPPRLFMKPEEVLAVREKLESEGISRNDRMIGICPGTGSRTTKQWIPERFAELADQLAKRYSAKILILGGPHDQMMGEAVRVQMKEEAWLLMSLFSLREMMAAISLCDLCVTNDSGPMHIASALGIPYVTLFGPTLPEAAFPGGENGRAIYHPVNCSPCWFRVCPVNHHCMTGVSAGEVLEAAEEMMNLSSKFSLEREV